MYARYFFKASSFKIFWKPTFPFSLQITCSGRLVSKMKRSNKRHDSSKGLKKRARSGSERVKIVFITRHVPNLPRFFHSSVTIALSITALCITRTERLEKTRLKRNVGQINILRKKSNHIALIIDSMQYYRNNSLSLKKFSPIKNDNLHVIVYKKFSPIKFPDPFWT